MVWVILFLTIFVLVMWSVVTSNLLLKIARLPVEFNPKSFGCDFQDFSVTTADGVKLAGWFVSAKKKTTSTILVLHGWGANRSDVLPNTLFLAESHNLAYFDFRNHGRSGDSNSSLTCLEIIDLAAVVKYLQTERRGLAESIGLFGFSMGGAVALSGAAEMDEFRCVLAESPFSSYNETVFRFAKLFYGIPRFAVPLTLWVVRLRLGFDPEKCSPIHHISKISPRPVFIIQGGSDQRMPVSEGQLLYAAAGEPKEIWVVPEADHGGIQELVPAEYKERIANFFAKWLRP